MSPCHPRRSAFATWDFQENFEAHSLGALVELLMYPNPLGALVELPMLLIPFGTLVELLLLYG